MTNKLKHLDFIQLTIGRLSNNSLLIKGWSVLTVSTVLAIAFREDSSTVAFLTILPIIILWVLDAYYLSLERLYRDLYDEVRIKADNDIDFSMKINNDKNTSFAIISAMFSGSVIIHYFGMIFLIILAVTYL